MRRAAWLEIDLGAIAHNVKELRRATQSTAMLMAVVKANAYGHGAVEVSRVALANGADWLAVATLDEALELRESGFSVPLLIMGHIPAERAEEVVAAELRPAVFHQGFARALSQAAVKLGRTVPVHVKVDSGMGRIGFPAGREAVAAVKSISRLPGIKVEGIFTHLAASDSEDKRFARLQLQRFDQVWEALKAEGLEIRIRHAANSGAIIDLPESHYQLVRAGISLYGYFPSDEVNREAVDLKPAMTLKAEVVQVKEVTAGTPISYGMTYYTSRSSRIATLPLGYADGYPRLLSNRAEVLVRGRRAPVVGRVCMDQLMIEVGHLPQVELGDEVVLLGEQMGQRISAEELGRWAETINYEIVTRMGSRLDRIYTGSR
ncbi:MAG: alanine racemase [Syntrophomonadaceae bacterium]|nr:alanine racemase [Syntrophomonadaceae bacterium]